jgi:hypothetical protein
MPAAPGRLEVLAALLALTGALLCARGMWRLLKAIRARFTYGAPYHHGMIGDRLYALGLEAIVLALGLALGFLAWAQASFQPNEGMIRVGRIEARRSGWGRTSVRFLPDPLYPDHGVLQGEISGARWAVAGDFLTWSPGIRWLGLRDAHRLRYLVGTRDTTGTTPARAEERTTLEPLPAGAARLVALAPWLPFLRVHVEASPWHALADLQVMDLYAIGPGYFAQSVAQGEGVGRPPGAHPLDTGPPPR